MSAEASPAVSIVTPAYNAAGFIGETRNSVVAQSYTDWEWLVVDDCSKDATRDRVRQFSAEDPRIRLIEHATNAGARSELIAP